MSLLIITGNDPEHRYVANRIAREHCVTRILVVGRRRRRSWHKVLRKTPLVFMDKALLHLFQRVVGDAAARQRALHDVLGKEMCAEFHETGKLVHVEDDGGSDLVRNVAKWSPDVIAVYGTGIIPDDVLVEARIAALNMHTGLSPRYRGTSCAFWPIYERSPDWVGATVHACTSVLDGGEIYATRRARLYRGDDLHRIFARAVQVGSDAYVEVLHDALSGALTGAPQDLSAGREYHGWMRGFRAEALARWRLSRMRRGWPAERANCAFKGVGGARGGCTGADGR
jgi:methionyl-tRNA formyltransferase